MVAYDEALVFRGRPGKLCTTVTLAQPVAGVFRPTMQDGRKGQATAAATMQFSPVGHDGLADVRLHMDRTTAPGEYRGTVAIAGRDLPFVAEVSARRHVRLLPPRLRFAARPGARLPISITVLNDGNVPVEVPGAAAFGLFDIDGMDAAIGETLLGDCPAGSSDVERLFAALRRGHGGLAKLRLEHGATRIEPAHALEIGAQLQVPEQVRPGQTYWGMWPLLGRKAKITLDIEREPVR